MKRIVALLVALVLATSAVAGPNGVGVGINGALGTAGQLIGTTTNDAACTGCIGEKKESTVLVGGAVSLTSTVATNVTSVSLTAGDWFCWASLALNLGGTTTMTVVTAAISTVSATIPTYPNGGGSASYTWTFATGVAQAFPGLFINETVAATTTVYLVTNETFAVSTNAAYGYLGCRRVR